MGCHLCGSLFLFGGEKRKGISVIGVISAICIIILITLIIPIILITPNTTYHHRVSSINNATKKITRLTIHVNQPLRLDKRR